MTTMCVANFEVQYFLEKKNLHGKAWSITRQSFTDSSNAEVTADDSNQFVLMKTITINRRNRLERVIVTNVKADHGWNGTVGLENTLRETVAYTTQDSSQAETDKVTLGTASHAGIAIINECNNNTYHTQTQAASIAGNRGNAGDLSYDVRLYMKVELLI